MSKMDCRGATVWGPEEICKENVNRREQPREKGLALAANPSFGDEAISHPGLGLNVLASCFVFEFLAQLSDEYAKVLGLMRGLGSPHSCEQGAVGHDLAGVARKVNKQVEFLGRQAQGLALHGDRMGGLIHDEIACFNRRRGAFGGATHVSADASKELLDTEGLGDVVIGACIERLHLGSFVVADGENQNGRGGDSADGAANIDTGHAGHHEVSDDKIGSPLAKEANAFLWFVGGAHVEALCGERGAEHAGNLRFVVNNENTAWHFAYSVRKLTSSDEAGMMALVGAMRVRGETREAVRWFLATLAAGLTTTLLIWLGVSATSAGMVFLVLVVLSATQSGIWLSLYMALICAVAFDYFFLPPTHTFVLAGPQEWVAMLAFAACSMVAGRVAENARRQTRHAEQRREDVERLYLLSQEMMLHEDASGLIRDLAKLVQRIFSLDGVILYLQDQDQFFVSGEDVSDELKQSLRDLSANHTSIFQGPEGYSGLSLMLGLSPVGALGWRPSRLSREVATAVGAQIAIALTRAFAIEASARLEASREGERLRTALIDSLTHELRTPLTSIRAAATTLMQGEGLNEAGRLDLASIVDEEASRLDMLIGEAVEMAEIDANVVKVHMVQEHARTVLDHAAEESAEALARHQVSVDVAEPDEPVWFDPHLLGRVLRHLLENAARYSPPGSEIVLRSFRSSRRLEFAVEDNGAGIDRTDLPLIFEKFYRGKKSAAMGKGTGMGLAIARAILTAHGGGIEVSSVPGKGSAFRFWVPLVEKDPEGGR